MKKVLTLLCAWLMLCGMLTLTSGTASAQTIALAPSQAKGVTIDVDTLHKLDDDLTDTLSATMEKNKALHDAKLIDSLDMFDTWLDAGATLDGTIPDRALLKKMAKASGADYIIMPVFNEYSSETHLFYVGDDNSNQVYQRTKVTLTVAVYSAAQDKVEQTKASACYDNTPTKSAAPSELARDCFHKALKTFIGK